MLLRQDAANDNRGSYLPNVAMTKFDLNRKARELGQDDPAASRWEPPANENDPAKPTWQGDLFLVLLVLTLVGGERSG